MLKIDGHRISSLQSNAFVDSDLVGKLLRFHLSNGNLSTLPVESFQQLRKLKTLDLHGNKLKELKRNQFKGLRDVEVLDISHNEISKVDASHIADLTKMSWFNASHNAITELVRYVCIRSIRQIGSYVHRIIGFLNKYSVQSRSSKLIDHY